MRRLELSDPHGERNRSTTVTRRLADVLVDVLAQHGVTHVFGVPGGAVSPLHDALLSRPEIRVLTSRHESGAMFAAAGYARASQRLGVVLVTSGPGVLSALNGLASAFCDGLPLLVIAGEVARARMGMGALQDGSSYHLDIVAMARSITKWTAELGKACAVVPQLTHAIGLTSSGRRGPVLLTLPVDVGTTEITPPRLSRPPGASFTPDANAIEHASRMLLRSERPLILAGSGARWGEGPKRLRELAEAAHIPVVTTPKAKGVFPEDHPLSLGIYGFGGHASASSFVEQGVDTLLVVGSGLGEVATNGFNQHLGRSAHLIQIDIETTQIGRSYPASVALLGEAGPILAALCPRAGSPPAPRRSRTTRYAVDYDRDPALATDGADGRIEPHRALWELQQIVPSNTIYTCDIGEHLLYALHYLRIRKHEDFCAMTGLGSMGSGIGAAVGIQLASPERPVVSICGDGGFVMSIGDIATASRERIPTITFVLNDQRFGMCEIGHETVYGRRPDYSTNPVAISELARGAGARVITVQHTGEVLAIAEVLRGGGPVVVDVRIDRSGRMKSNGRNTTLSKARAEAGGSSDATN